jgi:hypothetical protein
MPGSTIGEAWIAIRPDTSAFASALESQTKGSLSNLGKSFAVVGAAAAGAFGFAIDSAEKFQTSLLSIDASMRITTAQGTAIGNAFLSTAGKATFSANQIAAAFAPVSGQLDNVNHGALDAKQSLGFMDAAMHLAEATGADLATTTANLAGVLQAFGLGVNQATSASDLLYNVSNSLGLGVDTVSAALEKLHAKMGPVAGTLPQLGALFEDLATHGLTGSRALLLVSSGMNTLLNGSDTTAKHLAAANVTLADATKHLDELRASGTATATQILNAGDAVDKARAKVKTFSGGVAGLNLTLYDAKGNFVGMQSVIAQLAPKLAGMTEQQRLLAEKTLFGTGASKALDDTIMAGLPGWDASTKKVNESGTALKAATEKTSGLKGDWDRLKSSVSDLATQVGTALLPKLTDFVTWITHNEKPIAWLLAGVASLYGVHKGISVFSALAGDANSLIGMVSKAFGGGGGGGTVSGLLGVQKVFVVNMPGGGIPGGPGVPVGPTTAVGVASTDSLWLTILAPIANQASNVYNAWQGVGALSSLLRDSIYQFNAKLGPKLLATGESASNVSLEMTAIDVAVAGGHITTQTELTKFEKAWLKARLEAEAHAVAEALVTKNTKDIQFSTSASADIYYQFKNKLYGYLTGVTDALRFQGLNVKQAATGTSEIAALWKAHKIHTKTQTELAVQNYIAMTKESGGIPPTLHQLEGVLAGAKPDLKKFADRSGLLPNAVQNLLNALGNAAGILVNIKSLILGGSDTAAGELAKVRQWALSGTGPHAGGGFIPPGEWGTVGEHGTEMAFGGRTGMTVVPHGQGSGGGITQHNYFYGVGKETVALVDERIRINNRQLILARRAQ